MVTPDSSQRLLDFLAESPTPWHAVEAAVQRLQRSGFVEMDAQGPPSAISRGQCGFIRRSGTLLAFIAGKEAPAEAGFRIISAHTDSPNLRVKPQPIMRGKGWIRLGLEVYGGVIQATWTDRDLGLAGQVWLRDGEHQRSVLVRIDRPLCRIPNLAIHLNRTVNDEGLKLNAQTQLPAVFSLESSTIHEDPLRHCLAEQIGCAPTDILSWDLCLFDLTAPTFGGLQNEFIFSARLDNLASCHAGIETFLAHEAHASTAILALFDHEEIGSTSSRGAESRLLLAFLERILQNHPDQTPGDLDRALANSWHLSSDMAHAVHPAWLDKHEPQHMPELNKGPVIKQNANQRYGTEGETSALVLRLAEAAKIPIQWFVNRTDLACGSTVGPIIASQLGIRTVDVGNPMLSMHSIREMCGALDQQWMIALMSGFLRVSC